MPRNNDTPVIDGATALGLTAIDELDGVSEVKQGASKFDGLVLDFTSPEVVLVPAGTEVELTIKGGNISAVGSGPNTGDPKISFRYEISECPDPVFMEFVFFDDLQFTPPRGVKKGTMWRVRQMCEAVKYDYPISLTSAEIMPWLKQFKEDMLGEKFKAVLGINESTDINPKTGKVYDKRQKIDRFISTGDRSLDDLFG